MKTIKPKKRNFPEIIQQCSASYINKLKHSIKPNPLLVKDLILFYLIRYCLDFKENIENYKTAIVNREIFIKELDNVILLIEDIRQGRNVLIDWTEIWKMNDKIEKLNATKQ